MCAGGGHHSDAGEKASPVPVEKQGQYTTYKKMMRVWSELRPEADVVPEVRNPHRPPGCLCFCH